MESLVGKKFGRLLVLEQVVSTKKHVRTWKCICDCGNFTTTITRYLTCGDTKSCGCLYREVMLVGANRKHGLKDSVEYHSWCGMMQRCYDKKSKSYKNYGNRGIIVSEEWHDFEIFIKDMGFKPAQNFSIERLNNNDNYTKENCIWATRKEQNRNKRNNIYITHNNLTKTLRDWENSLGFKPNFLYDKMFRKNLSFEGALNYKKQEFKLSSIIYHSKQKRWHVYIRKNDKLTYISSHKTEEEAKKIITNQERTIV